MPYRGTDKGPVPIGTVFNLRMDEPLIALIDEWRQRRYPVLPRSAAIEDIVAQFLGYQRDRYIGPSGEYIPDPPSVTDHPDARAAADGQEKE
jgi:hypothetical protein